MLKTVNARETGLDITTLKINILTQSTRQNNELWISLKTGNFSNLKRSVNATSNRNDAFTIRLRSNLIQYTYFTSN